MVQATRFNGSFCMYSAGPNSRTLSTTLLAVVANFSASAEEIQENCRRPGSRPMNSSRLLAAENFRLANILPLM